MCAPLSLSIFPLAAPRGARLPPSSPVDGRVAPPRPPPQIHSNSVLTSLSLPVLESVGGYFDVRALSLSISPPRRPARRA